ncbi:MAG: imelysin family protein [Pseudomonadota bacterium]
MFLTVAAPLWLATASTASDREAMVREAAQASINGYIRPMFGQFGEASKATSVALESLCSAPSEDHLNQARAQFADLVSAWSRIEFLRFGPLAQNNRFERLHFWPDRRGRALRQVQAALATTDPSVTATPSIAGKSVAVQGLGALEYLLFGAGSDDLARQESEHRCAFAHAVGGNVADIAAELRAEWNDADGFVATLIDFGPENASFRNAREVAVQMFATVVDGLAWVSDVKLRPALGEAKADAKPKRAIFWRSGQTFRSIQGNLDGLEAYLIATRLLDLLPEDQSRFAQSIRFEFANAKRTLEGIETAPLQAFAADPARGKLSYLLIVADSLGMLMEGRVGPTLGIEAGFSVLDGD